MPQQPIKIATFLANLPLFREMALEEVERIAQGTREIHAERGTVLFHRGDPCVGFHVVVYGQVKLAFTSTHGSEKVVEIVGPGASFGEALMFMEKPYIVAGETLADSMLLHIGKQTVFTELERDPLFARKMLAGLSRRLHGLINDVEAYSLRSGAQRVVGFLLREEADEVPSPRAYTVTLPAGKAVIASRLSLTPEHFSRILRELTEAGLIHVNGRDILVLDVGSLREYGA